LLFAALHCPLPSVRLSFLFLSFSSFSSLLALSGIATSGAAKKFDCMMFRCLKRDRVGLLEKNLGKIKLVRESSAMSIGLKA